MDQLLLPMFRMKNRRNLDRKVTEGIMVGHGDSSTVYKIWDPVARKIITRRNVVFDEKCNLEHSSVRAGLLFFFPSFDY